LTCLTPGGKGKIEFKNKFRFYLVQFFGRLKCYVTGVGHMGEGAKIGQNVLFD